ncbi:MAG TPA: hypothetical protein VG817_01390, partial [Gemmatimonadales bacterium]|nr:hypothetical protein [Gemmatimonadales bacterium]
MRGAAVALLLLLPCTGQAQQYLLRLDSRVQSASYRGVRLDSVPVADVITDGSSGPRTSDGYAVTCISGRSHCSFFRPGARRRGGPWTTDADLTAWGFGLPGLSLHLNTRLGVDLGTSSVWPGTDPAVQLFEGYAEYAAPKFTARLGRQIERGRLDYTGFDGGRLTWRFGQSGLAVSGLLGLGLARATALPVSSDVLQPLDDFQPSRRQLVAGLAADWASSVAEVRLEYQRQVDRETHFFVSERAALTATLRPATGWSVSGGTEYDFDAGWWGTSELTLRHDQRWGGGSLGLRRYRPYFDLWTSWGAFSPVPHKGVTASVWLAPWRPLRLRGAAERYTYDDPGATAPLVSTEDRSTRWAVGATLDVAPGLSLDGGYYLEQGIGAASRGWDASATWQPRAGVSLTASGGILLRPLELRYDDARVDWVGASADLQLTPRASLGAGIARYAEERRRPDAAALDWNQTRLRAYIRWLFGSG